MGGEGRSGEEGEGRKEGRGGKEGGKGREGRREGEEGGRDGGRRRWDDKEKRAEEEYHVYTSIIFMRINYVPWS